MVTTKMNWLDPNCDFLPKWITFGPDQFILVVTISFRLWPNHYGQVQINLVRPKSFWTDQNCFGYIEGQGIRVVSDRVWFLVQKKKILRKTFIILLSSKLTYCFLIFLNPFAHFFMHKRMAPLTCLFNPFPIKKFSK